MDMRILICTDLDRTLLPNGPQPASPQAHERFARVTARPDVALAYVSGRHRGLVEAAIQKYGIPVPDYVIGDVGTSIYTVTNHDWTLWDAWAQAIGPDWAGLEHQALHGLFQDIDALTLQEPTKQGPFKLSYYAPAELGRATLEDMEERLRTHGIKARLIWSVDETGPLGLVDILPVSASKLHAIEFLVAERGFSPERVIFSGDSGNDLPVLVSPLQAVLVANATDEVRTEALREARRKSTAHTLYLARGSFKGMNGNYSAGILEGLAHYLPETADWLEP
jgi:HAD superfamily hydrolase (TIGR01484 family)